MCLDWRGDAGGGTSLSYLVDHKNTRIHWKYCVCVDKCSKKAQCPLFPSPSLCPALI